LSEWGKVGNVEIVTGSQHCSILARAFVPAVSSATVATLSDSEPAALNTFVKLSILL
jgi:hypothetical protein